MTAYILILIVFFVASGVGTWWLNASFKGSLLKHIIGLGLLGSLIYDGYLIAFVPFQGFQDLVRLLTLYALLAGFVGYAVALLWLKWKVKRKI